MSAMPEWLVLLTAAAEEREDPGDGGAAAFLFVIWPSIRIQTKFIEAQEKKAVDGFIENL